MSVISAVYETLFGKNHLQDGTVIDLAEHGRNGGISTGQGFKMVQIAPLAVRLSTNASLNFYGFSKPGVNASEPYWRIMAEDVNGNIYWANGSEEFTNSFINLSSLPFS